MDAGQKTELERRYQAARSSAEERQLSTLFTALEELAASTAAVINVGVRYAHHFFVQDNVLYAPYARQAGATRSAAEFDDHRRRTGVDAALYADYGSEIVYAALTADGLGLLSYGLVHMVLQEAAITRRASVLEENSYTFVQRHGVTYGDPLPEGYLATWPDRSRLAAAKLGPSLSEDHAREHLPRLLLRSDGDRGTDDFLEVHIYGTFNWQAVTAIWAPEVATAGLPDEDRTLLEAAKVATEKKSVEWKTYEYRMD